MKPWLFVGASVTPVRFAAPGECIGMPALRPGEVYVVREVTDHGISGIGVRLVGITGMNHPHFGPDCPYGSNYFRPVSTIDATPEVEALRKLAREASQTGKVSA